MDDAGARVDKRRFIKIQDIGERVNADSDMFAEMAENATAFVAGRPWCQSITQGYLDRGLAGVIAVFYFEYERTGREDAPPSIWLINGVLPLMFVPPSIAVDGMSAIDECLIVLDAWCEEGRSNRTVDNLPKVFYPNGTSELPPTPESVDYVSSRVSSMREMVIPWLWDWEPEQD